MSRRNASQVADRPPEMTREDRERAHGRLLLRALYARDPAQREGAGTIIAMLARAAHTDRASRYGR